MTTLDAPQLQQSPSTGTSGLTGWLGDNKWWLLTSLALAGVALILYLLLKSTSSSRRLQRDALVKLRKNLIESCKATRGPAKTIWLTGSPRDPPTKIGRYVGHHRAAEATWLAYRTWFFGKTHLLCTNPVDLSSLDAPELHVRGIAIRFSRDLAFATPDVHDARQREDWQRITKNQLASSEAFDEETKAYYARAVDNAIAFYDSLNAAEDRSFLRQEVTRGESERTETISIPTQPTQGGEDAPNT